MQLRLGQINPSVAVVLSYVSEDVGQLKSDAEVVGIFDGIWRFVPENADADYPNRTCHASTVNLQVFKSFISIGSDVHPTTVDDIDEVFFVQIECLYRVGQCSEYRISGVFVTRGFGEG